MGISYPVPTIVKSRSECPKSPLFMENVEVVPGTANIGTSKKNFRETTVSVDYLGLLPEPSVHSGASTSSAITHSTISKSQAANRCGLCGYLTWYLQSSNHALRP